MARLLTVPGEVLSSASPRKDNLHHHRQLQQQYQPQQRNNNDIRNMSHAQARAELYNRPSQQPTDDLNNDFSNMKGPSHEEYDDDEEDLR